MLAHGGGVAGAISRAGGPAVQRESDQWVRKHGSVDTGAVAVTGPGRMICRWIIHAGMRQASSERASVSASVKVKGDRKERTSDD